MRYATLRIGIFLVSLAVLWGGVAATGHIVTGNGVLYLMMGALLVSGVASFFLLSRQRDAMSVQVTGAGGWPTVRERVHGGRGLPAAHAPGRVVGSPMQDLITRP